MSNGNNPGQPPFPPFPGGQQPGMVPQQPTQAPQAAPTPQVQAMPPVQVAQPSQGSGTPPGFHIPDEQAIAKAYQAAREEAAKWSTGGDLPFIQFMGPGGQKWSESAHPGYESFLIIWLMSSWAEGKSIFKVSYSHFWKSHQFPRGFSINCPGQERCMVCQKRDEILQGAGNELQKKKAKDFGKTKKQYIYNVVALENYQGHFINGVMRPMLLGAGYYLHKAIGDLLEGRGVMNIVHPTHGRPLRLKKKKTGPENIDVEYSALDMNPMPLDPAYYPCFQNIWNLDEVDRVPTQEEMMKAVVDMGLMGQQVVQQPQQFQGFQTQPQPPHPNPFFQPQVPQAPVPQAPEPDPFPPIPVAAPQQPIVPAMPAPPPIHSSAAATTTLTPQAGVSVPGQPPQQPVQAAAPAPAIPPAPPVVSPQQQQFKIPENAAGVTLPGQRERCYGKANLQDQYCQQCPDWVKSQCIVVSGTASSDVQPSGLTQLQNQLGGQE